MAKSSSKPAAKKPAPKATAKPSPAKKPTTKKAASPSATPLKKTAKKTPAAKPPASSEAAADAALAAAARDAQAFKSTGEPCEPSHELCCAKRSETGRLFLKFAGGELFQPGVGMKLEFCGWRPVEMAAYAAYVEYLRTRNEQYYRRADRIVTNSTVSFAG